MNVDGNKFFSITIVSSRYGASLGESKTLKGYMLRVFTMSDLLNITGDYRVMTGNRKRLFKQLNAILTPPFPPPQQSILSN